MLTFELNAGQPPWEATGALCVSFFTGICWKCGLWRTRALPTSSGAELQVVACQSEISLICAGRKLLAIRRSQERSSCVAVLPAPHGRVRRRASLGIPSAAKSSVTSWQTVSAVSSLNRSSPCAKLHLQATVPSTHQLRLKQLLHTFVSGKDEAPSPPRRAPGCTGTTARGSPLLAECN